MLTKTFVLGLLAGSVLSGIAPVFAATNDVVATTKWQVSRVSSEAQGSYCAMAQKFSDKTVLTIARNERNEYSLAIERADAKFKKGEEQDITLRPNGGAAQTYVAFNQTERTATVGIGANNPLVSQLAKSGKLEVVIDKSSINYAFAEYAKGVGDLDKCISSLSADKGQAADMEKSQLKAMESAPPVVKKDVAKVNITSIGVGGDDSLSAENILAVKPSPMPENLPKETEEISKNKNVTIKQVDVKPPEIKVVEAQLPKGAAPIVNENSAVSEVKGDDLRAELRNTRAQIKSLMDEKEKLNSVIEKLQKEIDSKQIKGSKDNWDLEQATRRYQESQREIRRLGALLDSNEQKFQKEKKELEYMLFDPEIAGKAQIAMLNNLEDQIIQKDKKISELEKTVSTYRTVPEQEKALADLGEKLKLSESEITNAKSDLIKKDNEIKDLQSKFDVTQQELKGLNDKIAAENKKVLESKNVSEAQKMAMDALNSDLTKATQKVVELEAKLAEAQAKLDAATAEVNLANTKAMQEAKDKELVISNALKMQKEKELADAAAKLANEKLAIENLAAEKAAAELMAKKNDIFVSSEDFQQILNSAGIPVIGNLSVASNMNDISYRAYTWKTSNLNGNVEMRKVDKNHSINDVVDAYLARAKSRCVGEFAALPSIISGGATGYEIACVTPSSNSSASVVFSYADGIVTTVAHEGNADVMDAAIDARDKIAAKLLR